ncbi:phosphatidylserine decarboxylase-like protein [Karstenula rhodostoma CBS 690.94]|uniref:Phosphatidylserine decarboxylase-like protein n=1 Tax=Karstenula rhodostoma CBS 690.94 TaxID=1392251 RepID=A0A9P4PLZ8_9PLEO|nr:phosphatidylserine decarboxylase-like protein [Karstenula rhodostoma CBS 690.94]
MASPTPTPAFGRGPLETTGRNLMNPHDDGTIQMGFWVPNRVYATVMHVYPLRDEIASLKKQNELPSLHPVVQTFKTWVEANSIYRMWINSMITQANDYVLTCGLENDIQILRDGDGLWIPDFDWFFDALSLIIQTSPSFNTTVQVGTPMNAFLAVGMGTPAGAALFHDAAFNTQFKTVLDAWNAYLKSPASLEKLDISDPEKRGSWISKAAFDAGVWSEMQHDPHKPGYGFASWNAFFIRPFADNARPFADNARPFADNARPFHGDAAHVVNLGCESTPWSYLDDVSAADAHFWVKDVQYSLPDLFGGRQDMAGLFDGGHVYQGFLSATHYHRWVERACRGPGKGENTGTWEGTQSQPYLGHVATRAIFLFEHPTVGFVAMICIGMVEVSTCAIAEAYNTQGKVAPVAIRRGDEIGHFEFGGSTHIMVFQRGKVRLAEWAVRAKEHQSDPQPVAMGSVIATAIDAA